MTYLHVVNLMDITNFAYTETKKPFPGTLSNACFTVHVTHLYSFAFSSTYRYFELGSVKALFFFARYYVKTNLMTFTANCHAHGYKISEFPIFTLTSVKCE